MRLFSIIPLFFASLVSSEEVSRAVPEAFTGLNYTKASYGQKAMVSAANPHAVNAGLKILEMGGSAVDAAIAVQAVLTLVEPQSSGIGGGAFLLHFDQQTGELSSLDGRETAPGKATPELFLDEDGNPIKWIDAVIGGRSVGVPGVLKMLSMAHKEHGVLPWNKLFEPAIELAEKGFIVSPRLAKLVEMEMNPGLKKLSPAKEYFYPNGQAIKSGTKLTNLPLAKALKTIAKQGAKAFYKGKIADDIVSAVQNADIAPGLLSTRDLADYQAKERNPVCTTYQSDANYKICSMGPPSSGGITVLQTLKILEGFDLKEYPIQHRTTVHRFTQAAKLAFADRNKYIADSDFIAVPVSAMLNEEYLRNRAKLIDDKQDLGKATAGKLVQKELAYNASIEQPNTSHISIIDEKGNAISMTTSIEMGFGSTVMVKGFLLNNQLTDFSLRPEINGVPVANRVEGNKRPRSSMAPVMVFKDGELYAVLGSPGGSRIINYVSYALVGLLEYGLDMQEVVNLPRVSNRNSYTSLEKNRNLESLAEELTKLGHKVRLLNLTSGIHGILKTPKGWQGAADPRREGTARGY